VLFSSILKGLREERKLRQSDIARSLEISRQSIALYETGKREPSFDVLFKIAEFFDVSIDYLFGRLECSELYAYTIGNNIRLLRGNKTYIDLSKNIGYKLDVTISPTKLEIYEKAKKVPCPGELFLLANYFGVDIDFFYKKNDIRSYNLLRDIKKEEQIENKKYKNPE